MAGADSGAYSPSGGPAGDLGAPTDDEHPVNSVRQQDFEGGSINYAPGSSTATVALNPRQPLVTATPGTVLSGTPVHLVAGGFNNGATVRVSQTGQPDFMVTVANGCLRVGCFGAGRRRQRHSHDPCCRRQRYAAAQGPYTVATLPRRPR